ncbi:hypothetical protein PS862_02845 [Pseudomonas fluorescens]|uniref:Prophage PssSM-03 n=1 Tax=Pseudomonas fluorescens TaxID=294 RepID=A0A5E7KGF0_PSEFL|nr:hypothetical protein [Pseudomonas fluorescens]VVP01002.1 hypothetical protein PS862_02845 [Pseudomonas fluorescens]
MQQALGPGFSKERVELELCPMCRGRAVKKGVFFELICTHCNGSGWVVSGSRLVLSSDELVTQLSFKLQEAQREITALKRAPYLSGEGVQYQQNNRRGAGGTNYTGD